METAALCHSGAVYATHGFLQEPEFRLIEKCNGVTEIHWNKLTDYERKTLERMEQKQFIKRQVISLVMIPVLRIKAIETLVALRPCDARRITVYDDYFTVEIKSGIEIDVRL